jgi:hypothetical protein
MLLNICISIVKVPPSFAQLNLIKPQCSIDLYDLCLQICWQKYSHTHVVRGDANCIKDG